MDIIYRGFITNLEFKYTDSLNTDDFIQLDIGYLKLEKALKLTLSHL